VLLLFVFECTAENGRPPVFSQKGEKIKKHTRLFNSIDVNQLHKTVDSLYCWKINENCNVIDGKTVLFSYYTSSYADNASTELYVFAKGEFLNGKYNGVWRYYDERQNTIRKEKWRNGKLIYKKEYK
jgi:hypothetical protein